MDFESSNAMGLSSISAFDIFMQDDTTEAISSYIQKADDLSQERNKLKQEP